MNKYFYLIIFFASMLLNLDVATAGNPDRQGEAGAAQLLMNPWARSAGLHSMTTSMIYGVEAMRVNPAGLSRVNQSEFLFGHTRYFEGTDININAFGFVTKFKGNSALGVSIMAIDMGDILRTTDSQPEGTGSTFSPRISNIGVSYSYIFDNKISVGTTFRVVTEGTAEVNAFAMALDAGVQYVTGAQDNFKFGISLRNIGSRMTFRGQGLSVNASTPSGEGGYNLSYFQRSQSFELPSLLNIGASYDFIINPKNRLTLVGNFTANSFSQDEVGGGLEYSFNKIISLRGGYKYEFGDTSNERSSVYTGVSAGVSIEVPVSKENKNKIGIDYAFRETAVWSGTHNFTIRLNL